MGRQKIITPVGTRFGKLEVIGPHRMKGKNLATVCICDCGNQKEILCANLRKGTTNSCGCLRVEVPKARATHGHASKEVKSRTYSIWTNMINRCTNPKIHNWMDYGGRGIFVCQRWRESFENFLSDMGEVPAGLSIDRINNDLGYEPNNCRWATAIDQQNNTSRNHIVEFRGESMTIAQWAAKTGISANVLYARINRWGWSTERALTTPSRQRLLLSEPVSIEYQGRTQTLAEWAVERGLGYYTLKQRIVDRDWSIEKALETAATVGRNQYS
jgi:hypothetical protein